MRGTPHIALLACAFALTVAGCGNDEDGTIPPDDADNMLNQVEAVQTAVEEGNCDLAQEHAEELVNVVNGLPNEVDNKVAGALTEAAVNLDELAATDCTSGTSDVTGLDTTETETTEPDTTETDTTVTETTTPEEETTTEEPEEEEPEEPAEEPTQEPPAGGGNQGGNEGGNVPPGGGLEPPSGGVTPGGGGG